AARPCEAAGRSSPQRWAGCTNLNQVQGSRSVARIWHKPPPLLVIDGDSFAHRAYHALPKTILRKGDRPAGAILGFANFLLRFYQAEQPRAVLVGWDTLDAPTYRNE